jgi:hypothetical protein
MPAMFDTVKRYREAVVSTLLEGPGKASRLHRRAAFEHDGAGSPEGARALLDKVTKNAWKVTDDDVAAAKQAGISEDEIFELAICASVGMATRQLESALDALDAATMKESA